MILHSNNLASKAQLRGTLTQTRYTIPMANLLSQLMPLLPLFALF